MKKKLLSQILVITMFILCFSNINVVKAAENVTSKLLGVWEGTYDGHDNSSIIKRNFRLEINEVKNDGLISGIATIDEGSNGKYYFEGKYDDSTNNIEFKGIDWISNPKNFDFATFNGTIQDILQINGKVDNDSKKAFNLTKKSNTYTNYAVTENIPRDYIGEYDGYSGSVVVRRNYIVHIDTVNTDGTIKGVAEFSPSDKADPMYGEYGKYKFKGNIVFKYGKISLQGYEWIVHPKSVNFDFVKLSGMLVNNMIDGSSENGIWKMNLGSKNQEMHKINLDPNGGTLSQKSVVVIYGQKYGSLPIPNRKNCILDGWYSKKIGGEKLNENSIVTLKNDITVYAHWKKKVTGKYKDGQTKKVLTDTEVYSDDYYIANSINVQGGLAKLSMIAASTVYKRNYAENLIQSCGFDTHKYVKKSPTKKDNDTVSYEIGIRNVDEITIVAVWIKGTSGDYEWVSNWNLGKGNTHKGFSKAEEKMNAEIEKYLKKNLVTLSNKGNVKLWITGHSRGAAIANLYAKRMNKKVGKKNVYAYTYATPRVSVNGKKAGYENIFNYLNPGDFVTEVAPAKWGYKRYGVDKILTDSKKNSMKKEFKKLSGKKYNGFDKKGKKSLLKAFINYAGKKRSGYYKKKPLKTPEYFCKKGLGYVLAGKLSEGIVNCEKVALVNPKCEVVYLKMIYDGKISSKFGYAHTQLGYLSWLKMMY